MRSRRPVGAAASSTWWCWSFSSRPSAWCGEVVMDSPGRWAAIGCAVLLLIVGAAIWGIVSVAAASRAANSVPRDG
ncbi:hypothetical protein BIV02_17555 [Curtobacterium sp. MMLR14_014]|nr:hypothetical protein BIU91_10085 [Curtobacterium sp. MMLR14_002]OII43950.1 hypothetical protein BIV02_17555 [Curtobacterium sp. MMLR14_014]